MSLCATIRSTLMSLLNELARLTVLNTLKRASSFDRDLRVATIKQEFHREVNLNKGVLA